MSQNLYWLPNVEWNTSEEKNIEHNQTAKNKAKQKTQHERKKIYIANKLCFSICAINFRHRNQNCAATEKVFFSSEFRLQKKIIVI